MYNLNLIKKMEVITRNNALKVLTTLMILENNAPISDFKPLMRELSKDSNAELTQMLGLFVVDDPTQNLN